MDSKNQSNGIGARRPALSAVGTKKQYPWIPTTVRAGSLRPSKDSSTHCRTNRAYRRISHAQVLHLCVKARDDRGSVLCDALSCERTFSRTLDHLFRNSELKLFNAVNDPSRS